jgi:hypothetical protein
MSLVIVGAGMAGLLAANMLRHHNPIVVEGQADLPNNHHAVLRFSSTVVGETLGIPFRKVTLVKHAIEWRNQVADILAYSEKATGCLSTERSVSRRAVEVADRWIAPPDLINQMASRVDVQCGRAWDFSRADAGKVISTVPMPSLMAALGYPKQIEFKYRHGWVLTAEVAGDCDAFATILVPNPHVQFYRASITGRQLIVESIDEPMEGTADVAAHMFCAKVVPNSVVKRRQQYAKILPIDDKERREFIYWASSLMNKAWSLGRFATWRPTLQTDHLVKDVKLIDGWIREGGGAHYDMELHEAEKKQYVM